MPVWDSSGDQISAGEVCGTQSGRYVSHCAVGQKTAFFCQNDAKLGEQKPAFFFRQLDANRAPCPLSSPNNISGGLSKPIWGTDGSHQFFSGVGSRGRTADVYVDTMVPIIAAHLSELNSNATIVDLGCGDFWVGASLLERLPSVKYIGCDVVPELVEYNRKTFGSNRIEFRLLDIVSADLPIGDVCLVRQVFQHLSNQEIACTLPKLQKYRHVYVTEAQPIVREGKINPDKPTGNNVRYDWTTGSGRGVELDQFPFNLDVDEVCRVPGHGLTEPVELPSRWPVHHEIIVT